MIQNEVHLTPTKVINYQNSKGDQVMPRFSSVTRNDIKNLSYQQTDDKYQEQEQEEMNELRENEYDQLFRSRNEYESLCIIWSNSVLLSNLYNFTTCCYFLGIAGFPFEYWIYCEFSAEVILIFDILLRLLFTIQLKQQWINMGLIHDQNQDKSLQKLYYFISSVPTSIIIYSSYPREDLNQLWIAFIRIFKLFRLNQFSQYFDKRDIRTKRNSFLRTVESIIQILMVTHLLGCIWLFVGRVDPNQSNNWLSLEQYERFGAPDIQKYIDSVFFVISSMTGLGFAYIYPRTNLEYLMQSIIMVVGVSTYANFFGFFAVSIYNRNRKRLENMLRLQESKNLAVLRNFPIELRNDIRHFYNDLRLRYDNLCDKFEILQELPNSLKSELSLFINSEIIQKVNFFQFADPGFILTISRLLKPKLSLQDNYIFYKGEVATKMYFIKSGIVQILATDNKTVIAYMSEGTYFGEIGVLLTQKRTCFVKSRTACVFFTIGASDLIQTLESFPIQDKFLRAVGKQRLKTTNPEDLIEKDRDFEIAAQEQIQLQSIDSKSLMGNLFEIQKKDQHIVQKEQNLMILNNLKTEIPIKVKIYLTKEYRYIPHFIIIPFSFLYYIWTSLFTVAFVYHLLYVPFSIGLDYEVEGEFYIIDIIALSIMIFDSLLRPFLAIDKSTEIDINKSRILSIYVSNYMLHDIVASIPLDYLLLLVDNTRHARQFFRLLRLFKFYRIREIVSLVRKHTSVDEPLFRICLLFLIFIITAHWFNCVLIFIAIRESQASNRFDGKNLLNFMVELPYSVQPKPDKMTKWQLYFNLMILCVCYMGSIMYGDIIPFTMSEELLGIFQMIFGRMFISFLFAEISSYVSSKYSTFNNHIQTKNRITKWMQLNNIDQQIRKRIIKHFDFKWENQKGIEEQKIIKDLPADLRVNVKNYIFSNLISHSDVFPKDDLGFFSTVTAKLQRRIAPKNEFIIKQGELATEMFFILKGEVIVVTEDGVEVATLKKYMHFGEMALIERKVQLRSTSVRASTDVVLAVLTQKDFDLICHHYPEFYNQMQRIGEIRFKDSLSKGVIISNERKSNVENKQLIRFLTQKKSFALKKNNNSSNKKQDDDQLSMIEEESKRESDLQNHDQGKGSNNNDQSLLSEDSSLRDEAEESQKLKIQEVLDGDQPQLQIKNKSVVSSSTSNINTNSLDRNKQPRLSNEPQEQKQTPEIYPGIIQLQTITENITTEAFNTRRNTIEIEQDGFVKIWEAPKLLSSVGDLGQYFKNVRGTTKKIYRKIVAIFLAQALRHFLLFSLVLYNIIFIPLQMGFSIRFEKQYLFLELITLSVYFIDLGIIARSIKQLAKQRNPSSVTPAGVESQSKLIHDQDELSRRLRFLKLNFISTLIGVVPFSWIFQDVTSPLFLINFLRVLRLVKIWPFYRVIQIFKKINVNFVRWIEVLITYYIVGHIVAGVMLSEALTTEDIRMTWLNRLPSPLSSGVRTENNLDGLTNSSLYIHAIYFVTNTISHVAIGDITTVSTDERALNSFIVWNLTFFYAFCFANIASIVGDFLGNNFLNFHEKFSNVMSMIPQDKVPKSIVNKVSSYYDYIWAHSQGFNETTEIFGELPTQLKYDVMMCRYQEAIQNSLIFKNEFGQIDVPMVNSIFELMKIRIYMPNEFIIKCGSYGRSLYLFLDGEALVFGINNELLCILTSGTHFNNHMGDIPDYDFEGKRLCHLIAKSLTIVGVIEEDSVKDLFEAFPYWKLVITKLNRSLQKRARQTLQKYMQQIGADPNQVRELKAIENHLTYSDDSVYEGILYKLEDPKHSFVYQTESELYKRFDFLQNQIKIFQQETGIMHVKRTPETSNDGSIIAKSTPSMGSYQFNYTFESYQRGGTNKINKCCRKIFFSSHSKLRKLLDLLHLLNMIYIAIALPLQIAFIDQMKTTIILEITSILLQILIIFVNFRTPIIFRGGYSLDFRLVLRNYLNNGLVYDLFGILPLNCILGYFNIKFPNIIIVSIFRLLRIISIQKLLYVFEKFEIHLKSMNIFMYILKTILILYLLWHWTACSWFYINKRIEPDLYEMTWYKTFRMDEKELIDQYLLSFYYVIKIVTGVGQSDMITYNDLERICFMIMINIGDTLFAFAFGLIASIQMHISQNNEFQKFLQKMKQIDEFLESINFDKAQSRRVEQYYSYSFYMKNKTNLIETKDLKGYLPYCLLKDVIYYSQREILIPMFRLFKSDNLIREVSSVLTNLIYMPGDYIIFKDQIAEEMYFIVEGQVQIIAADKQTVLKTLNKGNYFGEIAIFMHTKRISYVQANTFCVVAMLRKTDLDDIIINFPEVAKQFSQEAQKRIDETKELEKKKLAESENYVDDIGDDDQELSFIEAINNKLENSYYTMQSDQSNASLMKQLKKKSNNIDDHQLLAQLSPNKEGSSNTFFDRTGRKGPQIVVSKMSLKQQIDHAWSSYTEESKQIKESDNESNSSSNENNSHSISRSKKSKQDYNININIERDSLTASEQNDENNIEELKLNFKKKEKQEEPLSSVPSHAYDISSSDSEKSHKDNSHNNSINEIRKVRLRQNSILSPLPNMNKHKSYNKFQQDNLLADKMLQENDIESNSVATPKRTKQSIKQRRNTEILPNRLAFEFGKTKFQSSNKLGKKESIKKEPLPMEIFKVSINKKEEMEAKMEKVSIRRLPAKTKQKRRLSKISLGKNLMLSQTAGLKLQWTVGK